MVGHPTREVVLRTEAIRLPQRAQGGGPGQLPSLYLSQAPVILGIMDSIDINISADNPRMPRASQLAMMLVTSSLKADEPANTMGREVFNDIISECATESMRDPEFQACLLVALIRIVNVMADLAAEGMEMTAEEVVQITAPILAAWNEPGTLPEEDPEP
jgi:hypothetical protein